MASKSKSKSTDKVAEEAADEMAEGAIPVTEEVEATIEDLPELAPLLQKSYAMRASKNYWQSR